MMPVGAQIPGLRVSDGSPILVLGFDATHAICVVPDGSIEYVGIGDVKVDWLFDAEVGVWTSSTLIEGEEEDADTSELDSGSETDEGDAGRPAPLADPTLTG